MKLLGAAVAVCLLAGACAIDWDALQTREHHMLVHTEAKANPQPVFQSWVERFEKAYRDDVEEYARKFKVWLDNLDFIHAYNLNHTSHWLGLNNLADLTHEEFKQHALGYRADLKTGVGSRQSSFRYANSSVPEFVDWREKGAVTAVKNQAQCGSCWAFSTTGSIEGINQIYSDKLVSLSEQELVDCDVTRDHGCQGGLMDFAFNFVIQNRGIDTERDYKYKALKGQCNINKEDRHVVTIDGYEDVPSNDEKALQKAAANQPISVAIEADQREFQLYQGGVFDAACGTALDHGVLVVGYGTTDEGVDYWIVKNSWGGAWGDKGYIRLIRGLTDTPMGQCGIAMQASYPTKSTPNPPRPSPTPPGPAPPPKPEPSVCDAQTSCPNGSTCCCMREFFGYCFTWACCPLENATCCDDQQHCCPSDLPVCDTEAGRCLKKHGGGFEDSVEWSAKIPAMKTLSGRTWLPTYGGQQQEPGTLVTQS